ncbi:MAG: DMT family transporter [Thermoplasmatota archaeon]
MPSRPDAVTMAAFAGCVLLAGANGTAIAFSNQELAPFWGAALRFLPASWLFLAAALAMRRKFPRGRALVGSALYGVLAFFGTFGLIYWALREVKPGLAQLELSVIPLLTLLLATTQRQERFRWQALAGAVICMGGILLIVGAKVTAAPLGGVAALGGAALCMAQAGVVAKRFPKADIVAGSGVAMGVAGLLLLGLSLGSGEKLTVPTRASTWLALGYLVLAGSVAAFAFYMLVLQRWSASAAAYQWVLMPFVAVPLSAALTGEHLTSVILVGGAVVVAGVYLGAFWRRHSLSPAPKHP